MKKLTRYLILIAAVILLQSFKADSIKIGFIIDSTGLTEEKKAALESLQKKPKYEVIAINYDEISKDEKQLLKYDVIWWHRADSIPFNEKEIEKGEIIANYVKKGGKLMLTIEAVHLLNLCEIEDIKIETKTEEIIDDGYGRKLGFHARYTHPIFKGLNGGAYVWHAKKDHKLRKHGFFGNNMPMRRLAKLPSQRSIRTNIIGIDWAYITYHEDTKLLWETSYGKGKIFACGAYTYFAPENYGKQKLEKFLYNSIEYLAGKNDAEEKYNWRYADIPVSKNEKLQSKLKVPKAVKWEFPESVLNIKKKAGGRFNLAGEYFTIFGEREEAGVTEVWMHPFMALRDYYVIAKLKSGKIVALDSLVPEIENRPEALVRRYTIEDTKLKEVLVVGKDKPNGVIHYEWDGDDIEQLSFGFKSSLRMMWPYSSNATKGFTWNWSDESNTFALQGPDKKINVWMGWSAKPIEKRIETEKHDLAQADKSEKITYEDIKKLNNNITTNLTFNLKNEEALDFCFTGGLESINKYVKNNVFEQPEKIWKESNQYYHDFLDKHTVIETSDTLFNDAYKWAMVSADQFKVTTEGIGTSLMAGYSSTRHGWGGSQTISGRPGYAWYFGRDAEWSGLALNAYGDFETVKQILQTLNKFMDVNGKVYHELSSSGSVHYDAADATPMYVILAADYLKHSGDVEFIKDTWDKIQKAVEYCYSTDTDNDGLIELTNVGHGWVEGGHLYGAHSSFYIAGIWSRTLQDASDMARLLGKTELSQKYLVDAHKVRKILDTKFWNEKDKRYYFGLSPEGEMMNYESMMTAVPALFGQLDKNKAEKPIKRYASNDFSADWGVRIISKNSPNFNPRAYHEGTVWPLFTGWTALAEYECGRTIQGFTHAMNNLMTYKDWDAGSIPEVMHGLEYKPYGVCRQQCWSETMALQPLLDGMLGLKPNALDRYLWISPSFPMNWEFANVKNIRVGDAYLDMSYKQTTGKMTYNFELKQGKKLMVILHSELPNVNVTGIKLNGKHLGMGSTTFQEIQLTKEMARAELEITYTGGIKVIPEITKPEPGAKSSGIRIVEEYMKGNEYTILLEGIGEPHNKIEVFCPGEIKSVTGARIIETRSKGNQDIVTFEVDLPKGNKEYVSREVKIKI